MLEMPKLIKAWKKVRQNVDSACDILMLTVL